MYCSPKTIDPSPKAVASFMDDLSENFNSFLLEIVQLFCSFFNKQWLLVLIQDPVRELWVFGSRSGRDDQRGRGIRLASRWQQPGFWESSKKGFQNKLKFLLISLNNLIENGNYASNVWIKKTVLVMLFNHSAVCFVRTYLGYSKHDKLLQKAPYCGKIMHKWNVATNSVFYGHKI